MKKPPHNDDMIRKYMSAAGMLMEDMSAKMILEPLAPERVTDLRELSEALVRIADIVDVLGRMRDRTPDAP